MSVDKPSTEMQDGTAGGAQQPGSGKRPYKSPSLTLFGSVRDLTGGTSLGTNPDGLSLMVMVGASDRALKENVSRIGDHPAGFGLYLFDYKPEFRDSCGHGRQFGVMADEVEGIVPEAVSIGSNGYLQVDYALIGVTRH